MQMDSSGDVSSVSGGNAVCCSRYLFLRLFSFLRRSIPSSYQAFFGRVDIYVSLRIDACATLAVAVLNDDFRKLPLSQRTALT